MSKLLIALIAALCGCELVSAGFFGLFNKSNEKRLDLLLRKEKLPRDADVLMAETRRLAEELSDKPFGDKNDLKLAAFLADVVELGDATSKCNRRNLERASRVAQTTKANLLAPEKNKNLAKFMIATHLARLSARCERKSVAALHEATKNLVDDTFRMVSVFAHTLASFAAGYEDVAENPRPTLSSTKFFLDYMLIEPEQHYQLGKALFARLEENVGDDPDFRSFNFDPSDTAALKSLYFRYFVRPCHSYVDQLSPANFSLFFAYLEKMGKFGYSEDGGFQLVTSSWLNFEACRRILDMRLESDFVSALETYLTHERAQEDGQSADR